MARPYAVFDIDGTLIRWQLYHAIADELARMGLFDDAQFQKVKQARLAWKKRSDELSFDAYERKLVALVNTAISGISVADLHTASHRVIREYRDQVYTYTRDLVRELKAKDYLLFAISASQAEIVGLLARYYGFDDYGGSVYETKDGYFTGEGKVLRSGEKPKYLQELIRRHDAGQKGSIGVGDSESDIPMLSAVEQPIAFNPTKTLYEHAVREHWQIVVERKNMTYKLEPHADNYVLEA